MPAKPHPVAARCNCAGSIYTYHPFNVLHVQVVDRVADDCGEREPIDVLEVFEVRVADTSTYPALHPTAPSTCGI